MKTNLNIAKVYKIEAFMTLNPDPDAAETHTETNIAKNVWGDDAQRALAAVNDGPHYRKKRLTLLLMADATLRNRPLADVFQLPEAASAPAHYRWRKTDPDYEHAYMFLVGDPAMPGRARIQREKNLDDDELRAISALAEARTKLRLASADAVDTLVDALDAENKWGPKWHERILAANSILDRADSDTAARQAPALALVDAAIMNIYGHAADDAGHPTIIDQRQASLPANLEPAPPEPDQAPADDIAMPSDIPDDEAAGDEDAADLDDLAAFFSHAPTTSDQAD